MSRVEEGPFDIDMTGVPIAERTYWFKCDHCDNLHVVLEDLEGVKIATMVLDVGMLTSMVDTIHSPPSATKVTRQ